MLKPGTYKIAYLRSVSSFVRQNKWPIRMRQHGTVGTPCGHLDSLHINVHIILNPFFNYFCKLHAKSHKDWVTRGPEGNAIYLVNFPPTTLSLQLLCSLSFQDLFFLDIFLASKLKRKKKLKSLSSLDDNPNPWQTCIQVKSNVLI